MSVLSGLLGLSGDQDSAQRCDLVVEMFDRITGGQFRVEAGCAMLAGSDAVGKLSSYLLTGQDDKLALRILSLVKSIAASPALGAPARHSALTTLLDYSYQLQQPQQSKQQAQSVAVNDNEQQPWSMQLGVSRVPLAMQCQMKLYEVVAELCMQCTPPVPYAVVSGFVPVLLAALERHAGGTQDIDDGICYAAYGALCGVFTPGSEADVADFALSAAFDPLLRSLVGHKTLALLLHCVSVLDAAALRRVLTAERQEVLCAVLSASRHTWTQWTMKPLTELVSRVAASVPAFAQLFIDGPGLALLFSTIVSSYRAFQPSDGASLPRHCASLLSSLLSAAAACEDEPRAVQRMLDSGAVLCCCALLKSAAMWSGGADNPPDNAPSADAVGQLLRALWALIGVNTRARACSVLPAGVAQNDGTLAPPSQPRSPSALDSFRMCRGPHTLEMLCYADCMTQADSGPALRELGRLGALL